MRTLLLLLLSLSVARCFSTVPPLSHFHVVSLASGGNGETFGGDRVTNKFRAATLLTSTQSATAPAEASEEKKGYVAKFTKLLNNVKTAPFALSIAAFLLGYRLGGRSVASAPARPALVAARQYPLTAILLLVISIRDTWSLIPNWAKKNIPIIGKRTKAATEVADDPDDLTSFPAISMKLRSLYQRGKEKLVSGDEIQNPTIVFLAMLQVMSQIKQQLAHARDRFYEESGKEIDNPRDVLEGMDDYFEYADWAYDELPEGESLKGNLEAKGYSLLRHEKTALPGHVAHYVAVSPERKEALIGIKGTSGFEDLLTDCCGNAVKYEFKEAPFVEGARQEISCHEGILLSSKRLADDLLTFVQSVLLPSGYKITVTGHSLGAGVAVIFSMILRSRIEELRTSDKLKVLAFASPPILDYEASKNCESFVTTFINNSDVIPRCSLSNLMLFIEFMKSVNRRLDEEGLSPRDTKSTAAFVKWLATDKHDEMLLSQKEIRSTMDSAMASVDIDDPEHLYVPGRVVHMFDEWTKEGYGNKSDYEDVGDDFEESKKVPTAERVYVADGTARPLRVIEIDDRMMTDHLSPGYRASIKSLLMKADKKYPQRISEATQA